MIERKSNDKEQWESQQAMREREGVMRERESNDKEQWERERKKREREWERAV